MPNLALNQISHHYKTVPAHLRLLPNNYSDKTIYLNNTFRKRLSIMGLDSIIQGAPLSAHWFDTFYFGGVHVENKCYWQRNHYYCTQPQKTVQSTFCLRHPPHRFSENTPAHFRWHHETILQSPSQRTSESPRIRCPDSNWTINYICLL